MRRARHRILRVLSFESSLTTAPSARLRCSPIAAATVALRQVSVSGSIVDDFADIQLQQEFFNVSTLCHIRPAVDVRPRCAGGVSQRVTPWLLMRPRRVQESATPFPEAAYFFPLNFASGVYDITVSIGGERVVKGRVMDKAAAKAAFERAKDEGRTAAMLTVRAAKHDARARACVCPPASRTIAHAAHPARAVWSLMRPHVPACLPCLPAA